MAVIQPHPLGILRIQTQEEARKFFCQVRQFEVFEDAIHKGQSYDCHLGGDNARPFREWLESFGIHIPSGHKDENYRCKYQPYILGQEGIKSGKGFIIPSTMFCFHCLRIINPLFKKEYDVPMVECDC